MNTQLKGIPNFIIAGERRSGTTSLACYFKNHSDIYLLPKVDMAYFVDTQTKGIIDRLKGKVDYSLWAKKHSKQDYLSLFGNAANKKAIGEKSADYLFWDESHQRIKEFLPNVKIIISLRHPVERAWSQYINEVGKGREGLSFEEAILKENDRIKESDHARNHLSYVQRGFYDVSIKKLLKTFNKEQVYIVILEELIANPNIELEKIFDFLGVDKKLGLNNSGKRFNNNWTTFQHEWVRRNKILSKFEFFLTKVQRRVVKLFFKSPYKRKQFSHKLESFYRLSKKDVKMSDKSRNYLNELYLPHIENLELLLNKDLRIWKGHY